MILRITQCKKAEESSLFSLLRPSIHVVVYKFASSAQMKMLRKIVGCESFETSREHLYDGVFLSKVTSLQCSHCNFAINRTHHGFFLEYLPKTGFLKKCQKRKSLFFWENMSMVDQGLNKAAALYCPTLNFIKKADSYKT